MEVGTGFALMLVIVGIKLRRAITAGMDHSLEEKLLELDIHIDTRRNI